METKICSSCKLDLSKDSFSKCSKSKSGLQSVCKICKNKMLTEYYKLNPTKRTYNKERQLERYKKNKVNFNFSRRMRKSLNGIKESKSWETLVDYSLEELKLHLERQFTEGMSWDNYGEWHIDHIIPVSSFNIQTLDDENFKKCWSLENLQPLWAEQNIKKSNKILRF
jgi:5-methylcytosine-specific restriction endonuclease McrA